MLIHIVINGEKKKIHCGPDDMLMEVLRDAGYKSVKCGCDTTNCGLCTVWLDGKPVLILQRPRHAVQQPECDHPGGRSGGGRPHWLPSRRRRGGSVRFLQSGTDYEHYCNEAGA